MFAAVEFIVFVDGAMVRSELFHGKRLRDYPTAVEALAKRFAEHDWAEQPLMTPSPEVPPA